MIYANIKIKSKRQRIRGQIFLFVLFPLTMSEKAEILKTIADNIRKIRNEKKISQQELSDTINVAKSTIQRIEGATLNPTITVVVKICEALEVSVEEVLRK